MANTKKKPYEDSDAVKSAQAALAQQLTQKPGQYQSQWQQELDAALDQILNREPFHYDAGADPLYRQYRDQYVAQGRLSMLDTLGQAQTMTGGYGNSYAQTAAQQAYDSRLDQLNGRIPELYQLALSRYDLEGDALQERLGLLQQQEAADYGRYQDRYSQWADQRDYLAGVVSTQQAQDYDRYVSDRDYAFRQEQAAQEQARWQAEFDQALRKYEQELAAAQAKSTGKGGSYSGNGGVSAATVRKAQAFVGAAADGMWGSKSQAAAKAKGYGSLQEVLAAMDGSQSSPESQEHPATQIARMAAEGLSEYELNARIAKFTALGQLTPEKADQLRRLYVSKKYYA